MTRLNRRNGGRDGFTLLELITVLGIIVILAAIALPVLIGARKTAKKTAIATQLSMIQTALTAYEQDFKGYPPTTSIEPNGSVIRRMGFGVLGTTLVGPGGETKDAKGKTVPSAPLHSLSKGYDTGDCVSVAAGSGFNEFIAIRNVPPNTSPPSPGTPSDYWSLFNFYHDDLNGYGVKANGKNWGPYIQPDKLHMRGSAILDAEDNPIGFVSARPSKNNIRVMMGSGTTGSYVDVASDPRDPPQYDAYANLPLFVRWAQGEKASNPTDITKALRRMQLLMRAVPENRSPNPGCLDPQKTPVDEPYLLWSAGADGKYGPDLVEPDDVTKQQKLVDKCDDVTNFK